MAKFEGDASNPVRLISVHRSASFTVELPERAVLALEMLNEFGIESLAKAVERVSPSEALKHADGLKDLVVLGGRCSYTLDRLRDARDVIDGRKVAQPVNAPK